MTDHGPINIHVSQSQSQSQSNGRPSGCVGCLAVLAAFMVLGAIGSLAQKAPAATVVLLILVVAAGTVALLLRYRKQVQEKEAAAAREHAARQAAAKAAAVRAEVESRATVDAAGGCMWCGHRGNHRAEDGRAVHPRDWHAVEVEEAVAAAGSPGHGHRGHSAQSGVARRIEPAPTPVPPTADPDTRGAARPTVPAARTPDDELSSQLRYDESGECRWCGAPSQHRTDAGRIIHPARFHKAEYEAERGARENETQTP